MTRDEFLQKYWRRYPAFPEDAVFSGRLVALNELAKSFEVQLGRQGAIQTQIFTSLVIREVPHIRPQEVFQSGDLLAISVQGEITLLAPALKPLPSRIYSKQILQLWGQFLKEVRNYFTVNGFVEVVTPHLVTCPGTEPTLDVFSTEFVHGSKRQKLFLPTSPELHLKKALALGGEKIFEIKACFRNGEITEHHQPEFWMIEWYRAYDGLQSIRTDVQDLVEYLVQKIPEFRAPESVERTTIQELFHRYCDLDLQPATSVAELQQAAQKLKVDVSSATQIDDYFFLLFLEKIESQFKPAALTFVEKYPPYQAALARLTTDGWGDRFEVYFQGLEIANAFHELNDPEVQKKRFTEDLAKKKALSKEMIPLDEEFMQCLEAGMPPSGGIALGLDRLFMALMGIPKIADLRVFPVKS